MSRTSLKVALAVLLAATAAMPLVSPAAEPAGQREALVVLTGQAQLGGLSQMPPGKARGVEVVRRKQAVAKQQQALIHWLTARGIEHRAFWIANAVWVRASEAELAAISARPEVRALANNPRVAMKLPAAADAPKSTFEAKSVGWGNNAVRAQQVWELGVRGQGVVVAGQDTGYQWDHPALKNQYAGWDGTTAKHAYHWHDAIHAPLSGGSNPCGYGTAAPCDDDGHGTHTMGTVVGDDGLDNQIGMAPLARWIGCRNMDEGTGTPATYIECFQWFIAPTDASGQNPDPSRAPDVINNSWGCPISEGCDEDGTDLLEQAVDAVHAAGILVVVSAGNNGPACGTVQDAPAGFAHAFAVAATSGELIANFSSRGPSDGTLKPDISAPGTAIRSSVPPNTYMNFQGTSMASPHVAGVAALVFSAAPALKGNPDAVIALLEQTARPLTSTQNCGAFPGAEVPNAVFGHGMVDALLAYEQGVGPLFRDHFE